MELTLNIGFGQIVNLINQLPANQIAKIKNEVLDMPIAEKAKGETSKFREFILTGPVMSEEQFLNFKQERKHFRSWRNL